MVKLNVPKLKTPHIKTLIKLTVILALMVALGALTVAVVKDYNAKQTTKTNQHNAALQAAEQKGYERGTKENLVLRNQNTLLRLECQKGQNVFNSLTTSQKRLIKQEQVPNCSQPVLQ